MIKTTLYILAISLLGVLTMLMVGISFEYTQFSGKEGFLGIKQWVFRNVDGKLVGVWITSFYIHALFSFIVLFAGFTQFSSKWRHKPIHRQMGRLYVFTVLFVSCPSGLIMAFFANGGWVAMIAFITLSIGWWVCTYMAYIKIKKRNINEHRKWMIRSYALTLSALTLRLWKFGFTNLGADFSPMDLYRIVAWLGWVPNIIVAEVVVRYKQYNSR